MLNEINIAIIGENSLVSRVFQVGGEESIENLELITDGQGRLITNSSGQFIRTGRSPKPIITKTGRPIITGDGNYILAF